MLIINTEHESLSRTKMIYLFINGQHVDTLKSKQVKQYDLKPGKYQIQCRLNMYLTEPEIVEVKANGQSAFELRLKPNWTMFKVVLPLLVLGAVINFFINRYINVTVGNLFIVLFFVAVFYVNSRISRRGYLELHEIKNE